MASVGHDTRQRGKGFIFSTIDGYNAAGRFRIIRLGYLRVCACAVGKKIRISWITRIVYLPRNLFFSIYNCGRKTIGVNYALLAPLFPHYSRRYLLTVLSYSRVFEVINFGYCNFVRCFWLSRARWGKLLPSTFHSVTPRGGFRTLHDLGYIVQ